MKLPVFKVSLLSKFMILSMAFVAGCSDSKIGKDGFVSADPDGIRRSVKYHKKRPSDYVTVERVTFKQGNKVVDLSASEASRFPANTPGKVRIQFRMKDLAQAPRRFCHFEYVGSNTVISGQGFARVTPKPGSTDVFEAVTNLSMPTETDQYELVIYDKHTTLFDHQVEVY